MQPNELADLVLTEITELRQAALAGDANAASVVAAMDAALDDAASKLFSSTYGGGGLDLLSDRAPS
jgi:hypothetical protein